MKLITAAERRGEGWLVCAYIYFLFFFKSYNYQNRSVTDLFMTLKPFRFRAEAAIPTARPGALSAGYTSDNLP